MINFLIRTVPSAIHIILVFKYIDYIFASNSEYLFSRLATGFLILFIVNTALTFLVSKAKWSQLLISGSFGFIYFLLYIVYLILTGDPHKEVDDNSANGIILLFLAFPLSILSLFAGTICGITLSCLKKQVHIFREHNEDQ